MQALNGLRETLDDWQVPLCLLCYRNDALSSSSAAAAEDRGGHLHHRAPKALALHQFLQVHSLRRVSAEAAGSIGISALFTDDFIHPLSEHLVDTVEADPALSIPLFCFDSDSLLSPASVHSGPTHINEARKEFYRLQSDWMIGRAEYLDRLDKQLVDEPQWQQLPVHRDIQRDVQGQLKVHGTVQVLVDHVDQADRGGAGKFRLVQWEELCPGLDASKTLLNSCFMSAARVSSVNTVTPASVDHESATLLSTWTEKNARISLDKLLLTVTSSPSSSFTNKSEDIRLLCDFIASCLHMGLLSCRDALVAVNALQQSGLRVGKVFASHLQEAEYAKYSMFLSRRVVMTSGNNGSGNNTGGWVIPWLDALPLSSVDFLFSDESILQAARSQLLQQTRNKSGQRLVSPAEILHGNTYNSTFNSMQSRLVSRGEELTPQELRYWILFYLLHSPTSHAGLNVAFKELATHSREYFEDGVHDPSRFVQAVIDLSTTMSMCGLTISAMSTDRSTGLNKAVDNFFSSYLPMLEKQVLSI